MLFDTHTHVNLDQFDEDADAVIRRCLSENTWMVNVGTDLARSQKAVVLARQYEKGVYASVGLHPNDVSVDTDFLPYEALARDVKVVGIGETGLDYFRTPEKDRQAIQKDFFIKHIELARSLDKTLIVHCRDAHNDARMLLREHKKDVRGVMHFFTGTIEDARDYLELGMYISFSGVITFAKEYEELVRFVPLENIVVETDAPYAAPVPHRGKRNEPSFVRATAEKIAELKGLGFEEAAEATMRNARNLFKV